jgi:glycine/D-amino acid oxidase-like deaminating enzyme
MNVGIVGAGIFGLAAAVELRERGHEVVVFEQGPVPNPRASSTDTSKTIRRLYGDNATYVELVERAAPTWRRWDERLGGRFYFPIGQIQIERNFTPGWRIHDSWQFLRDRGELEILSAEEARDRYPQFSYQPGDTILFDPWGGYLASGEAVAGVARLARAEGVVIRAETPVRTVEDGGTVARIVADGDRFTFDRVVVAAGVWLTRLVPSVGRAIRPTFQEMVFFAPDDPERFRPGRLPVWGVCPEEDGWYGHPLWREGWVKVANDLRGPVVDPDVDRAATTAFVEAAREFVARRIPGLSTARVAGGRACLYENTPDRHFVIDWVPGSSRVLVAGGGSGHGFKFGGSIGVVIADALEDKHNPLGDLFRIGSRFD